MSHLVVEGLVVAVVLTASAVAQAQGAEPEAAGTPPATGEAAPAEAAPAATPAPAPAAAPAPAPAAAAGDANKAEMDGVRFRFGVAAGLGFFSVGSEAGGEKVSFTYYGGDLRFGAQINHLFGVYVQPTLGYYTADIPGIFAAGGLLGISAVADATIIDRIFVGAGIGYTVYNNPGGFSPILRIGAYPLMVKSDDKARRKGLMLGADLRFTSLTGFTTIVHPTFNIGYEAF